MYRCDVDRMEDKIKTFQHLELQKMAELLILNVTSSTSS